MTTRIRIIGSLTLAAAALVMVPSDAQAYIGPGVGLTALGTLVALIGAVFFAIVGFIWYPIKRLIATVRNRNVGTDTEAEGVSTT